MAGTFRQVDELLDKSIKAYKEQKEEEALKTLREMKEAVAKFDALYEKAWATKGDEFIQLAEERVLMTGFSAELKDSLEGFSLTALKPKDIEQLKEIHHLIKASYTVLLEKIGKDEYSKQMAVVQAGKSDVTLNAKGVITDFAKKYEKSKFAKLAGWALIIAGVVGVALGIAMLSTPASAPAGLLALKESVGLLGVGASLVGGGLALGLGAYAVKEKEDMLSKAAVGFLKTKPSENKGQEGSAAAPKSPKGGKPE